MERLAEGDGLQVHGRAFLAFCRESLLGDELFGIKGFGFAVLEFSAEGEDDLRMKVGGDVHQFGTAGVGDEQDRRVVAFRETEALYVVGLGSIVPIEYRIDAGGVELLYADDITLVLVHHIVGGGVEGAVGKDGQHTVFPGEFSQEFSAAFFVEPLDVRVPPDFLSREGGDALGLELDTGHRVLGDQVAAGTAALDGQFGEIPLHGRFLEPFLGAELDTDALRLSVVVYREPEDAGAFGPGGDVVILVPGDGGDGKALGIVVGTLSVPVNHIVDGALVSAVEYAGVQEVFPEEGLVAHLGYAEFAVPGDHDDFAQVGAVAEILALIPAQADSHEAFLQVGIQLGVVGDHLGDGDVLQGGDFRQAGPLFAVFAFEFLEPVDGELDDVVQMVPDFLHLVFQGVYFFVQGLGVELGNLADRFLHQLQDVFHHDLPVQEVFVVLHLGQDVVQLLFPTHLVLLQDLINAVLEEDPFQGGVVPVFLQFGQAVFQLGLQDVAGVPGVVFQNLVHGEEYGLVVADDAGVGGYLGFALGEGVEGVDGLVRRNIGRKMDDNLHLVGGHVLDFLDVDLLFVPGLEDAVDDGVRGFSVRDFRDGDGGLVHLVDAGTHLHHASPLALVVLGAVGDAAGGEVRQNLVRLPFQDGDGSIQQFVEVVRQNLGGKTRGDAFGSLGQQQRETHRQFGGLLVSAVIGRHPGGDFLVEDHFLGKLGKTGLDVTGSGVGVSGEDVAPVPLAVDEKTFLPQRHQGTQDGGVSVRMVLHGLSHDVGHLGVAAVVHLGHGVQHAALDRLETVHNVRYGTVQNGIRRIIQVPFLEHAGQLVLFAVAAQQPFEFTRRSSVFSQFFFVVFFRVLDVVPIFCHKD